MLSDNLVVPDEHDAVLLVPSLRLVPPSQATAAFEITNAMGNALLGVWLSRDPQAGDSDHVVEQVTLRTRDERTIAYCNILVPQKPEQSRWSQCKVHRWSGEMFGCLEPAAPPSRGGGAGGTRPAPAFVLTTSETSRLFFYHDPVSGGFVVNDEGSNQVVTVEKQKMTQQDISMARLAPKADTALILCCLLAIDRMTPNA